ncbi:TPA: RepB family plasmid replication initiator protein, partial [Acinetobacter baumannii]|nr:RepB family plasmid replication initiator protein [Acinetobacter baumannii]
KKDLNTLDLFTKMTDAQRHMFASKLSQLPEMSKYSQGTESYQQFSVRIAEMLQDPEQIKELYPHLKKVGYIPSNNKDTVNG